MERLEVARRIFKMVDKDGSGFLTEEEVFYIYNIYIGSRIIERNI